MSNPASPVESSRDQLTRLQRLLLPAGLPPIGCTEIAVEYRSHNHELELGGDWYDLVDRDDGQIVAIVGDVVGHGLEQISVMGQLRAAANALARRCEDPATLIRDLDGFAADLPGAEMTTMAVVMLDGSNVARIASAGHPPTIHVTSDGEIRSVEVGRRPPLTMGLGQPSVGTFEYGVDDLLVLYTDGLVERRGRSVDDAIEAVGTVVASMIDAPCVDIAARLTNDASETAEDDIAVLVMRPLHQRSPSYRLTPQAPPSVRIG